MIFRKYYYNGTWGSGKSSYLKTLQEDLKQRHHIIYLNVKKEFDNIIFNNNYKLFKLPSFFEQTLRESKDKYNKKNIIMRNFKYTASFDLEQVEKKLIELVKMSRIITPQKFEELLTRAEVSLLDILPTFRVLKNCFNDTYFLTRSLQTTHKAILLL